MLPLLMRFPGGGVISAVSSDLLVGYLFEMMVPLITTFEFLVLLCDGNSIPGGVFVLKYMYHVLVLSSRFLGGDVK